MYEMPDLQERQRNARSNDAAPSSKPVGTARLCSCEGTLGINALD